MDLVDDWNLMREWGEKTHSGHFGGHHNDNNGDSASAEIHGLLDVGWDIEN